MKKLFILFIILISIFSTSVYSLSVQDIFTKISDFFQFTQKLFPSFFPETTQSEIVINPNQGIGRCHWVDPEVLSRDYISWAYETDSRWGIIEPSEGVFDFSYIDGEIAKARNAGKKIWIEILTTESSVPQWAKDKGVRMVGGTPVPWDPVFKDLLAKLVGKLAERYDNDPNVEAVNIAAGGCYGEMALCDEELTTPAWQAVGYTNDIFIQTVKDMIDIYLGEYTMSDGTKNRGFNKKPVVLQLGSGLYGHTIIVMKPTVEYAMQKYGMRVWLKYNGWGGGYEPGFIFQRYWNETRVGYEPYGVITLPEGCFNGVIGDHSSYMCFQGEYLSNPSAIPKIQDLAKKIGSQIKIEDFTYPSRIDSGQDIQLTFKWKNIGATPLMRPERVGIKDIVASYDILVDLVSSSGETVLHRTFTPSTPTYQWFTNQEIVETRILNISSTTPNGQYNIRIGLINPDNENEKIKLLNTELKDENNRYKIGWINIGGDWPICVDTDGGFSRLTSGTCTDSSDTHTDSCSGCYLTEWGCAGGSCSDLAYNCCDFGEVCSGGKCTSASTTTTLLSTTSTTTTVPTTTTSTSTTTSTTTTSTTSSTTSTTTTRSTSTTTTTTIQTTTVIQCANFLTCTDCVNNGCKWCESPIIDSSGCKRICSWENCFQGTCFTTCSSLTTTTTLLSTTTSTITTTTSTTSIPFTTTTILQTTTTFPQSVTTTSTTTKIQEETTTTTIIKLLKKDFKNNLQTIVTVVGAVGVSVIIILLL